MTRAASWIGGLLLLAAGVGVGWLVTRDALVGAALQREILGPGLLFGVEVPYLWTLLLSGLALVLACTMAWMLRAGSWERPLLGLLVFSLFADVIPGIYQLSLLLWAVVLADRALRGQELRLRLTPLMFPLGLVVISYATTFLATRSPGADALKFGYRASYFALVLLLPVLVRSRRQLQILFHYMLIAAAISTAVALAQFLLSGITGQLVTFTDAKNARVVTPFGPFPRCTGLMLHPNHQASTLAAVAVMSLYFATRPKERLAGARRGLYLLGFAWLTFGVFLTWSRSGWLALGAGSLLVPLIRWPRLLVPYLLAGAGALWIGFQTGLLRQAYEFARDLNAASADFRWHMNEIAIHSFRDAPWIGRGVGGILEYSNPYHLQVHNTYLQVVAEMGLLGILAFAWLGGWLIQRIAWRMEKSDALDREWILALVLGFLIILIQNFFAMFLWVKFLWAWIALLEVSVFVSWRTSEPEPVAAPPVALPELHPRGT